MKVASGLSKQMANFVLGVTRNDIGHGLEQHLNQWSQSHVEAAVRKEKGRLLVSRTHQARLGVFSWHATEDSSGISCQYLPQPVPEC